MKKAHALLLIATAFLLCGCPSYNDIMVKRVREALGQDFKDYASFSYPTNNFGLLTAYTPKDEGSRPNDQDFLCDMWNCIGVADKDVPQDIAKNLAMNGFAAVGDHGGKITLTDEESKTVALKGALPEIYKVLNISGQVDDSSVVKTQLTIGQAWVRQARRKELIQYINSEPADSLIKKAFIKGDLLIIVADVVVDSMDITINADNKLSAKLDAALSGQASKVFSDATMSVTASTSNKGTYTFNVTRPVIVLRLAKRQPEGGQLAATDTWDDWKIGKVEESKERPTRIRAR